MKTKYIFILGLLVIFATSCQKEELTAYKNDARIYFFERQNDALATRMLFKSFTFIAAPASVTEDTVYVKVKIMGLSSSTDRIFTAKPIEGSTAVKDTHYKILNGTIKANEIEGYLPVVLYRTPNLKTESINLILEIDQSSDFGVGVIEDTYFELIWSDKLIKPDNWTAYELVYFFGEYSDVKYQFIIDLFGIAEFPMQPSRYEFTPGYFTTGQMNDFNAQLKEALAAYNASHDIPLTDENGSLVTFP